MKKLQKMAVFILVVAACNLVQVYRRFGGELALKMKGAGTSKTSVNFYQTARRNNQEVSHLYVRRHRVNVKSYSRNGTLVSSVVDCRKSYIGGGRQ
jgi:hypothetical protein